MNYVALAFCRRASAAERAPAERALAWLGAHELPDGSFAARSPNRDAARSHRYFSDAATGLAALARAGCDSVP